MKLVSALKPLTAQCAHSVGVRGDTNPCAATPLKYVRATFSDEQQRDGMLRCRESLSRPQRWRQTVRRPKQTLSPPRRTAQTELPEEEEDADGGSGREKHPAFRCFYGRMRRLRLSRWSGWQRGGLESGLYRETHRRRIWIDEEKKKKTGLFVFSSAWVVCFPFCPFRLQCVRGGWLNSFLD